MPKKRDKEVLNVAKILAPIIGSRDVVNVLRVAVDTALAKAVDLDFQDVEFVSRSAAHEILTMKEDLSRKFLNKKEIIFVNTNKEVTEMFRIVAANRAIPQKNNSQFITPKRVDIKALFSEM